MTYKAMLMKLMCSYLFQCHSRLGKNLVFPWILFFVQGCLGKVERMSLKPHKTIALKEYELSKNLKTQKLTLLKKRTELLRSKTLSNDEVIDFPNFIKSSLRAERSKPENFHFFPGQHYAFTRIALKENKISFLQTYVPYKGFLLLMGFFWLLQGCSLGEHRRYHDTGLKLQKEDYEKITKPPEFKKEMPVFCPKPQELPKIPHLTSHMKKTVSLNLREGVSLKSVLMELGRQTGVGIGLNPHISNDTALMYSAQKKPLIEVIKDICALSNLRFQIMENLILIEPDEPYLVTYNLQFLSHTRKSENKISVSTDVFSPLESQTRADNGSNSVLLGNSLVDFWVELENNLKMFLNTPAGNSLGKGGSTYSFHKQGGLVAVYANAKQQEKIADYFKKLKESISTQVIIEAKIIEVALDDAFKTGINWSQLGGDIHVTAPLGSLGLPSGSPATRDVFSFALDHEKFSSVLNLVKRFGTIRTLSNPRLTVMNNQPAMLKVATNEVFFHLEFERIFQSDGKPDIETISSDAMTVPIGLVMVVQPSVNLQTGEITMILRPTISRVQKEVEDPAVSIKSHQKVKSTVPVVQVRELDSVLKMKSGQVLVMGGLMEDKSSYSTSSVPLIDEIPLFGELAKGKDDERKITELVIFLTAHIVEDPYIVHADERIYNTYTEDPRPLVFKEVDAFKK